MNLTSEVTKLENAEIQITGELAWNDFEQYREQAIKNISKHVKIDGFREGKVPKDMVLKKVGDMVILEEMAQLALVDIYPKMLQNNKIDAIGRPNIQITKIAEGSALGFSITTATMPEVTLPDYKAIAEKIMKKKEDTDVADKEINDALQQLAKMRHHSKLAKDAEDPKSVPSIDDIKDKDVPALTDEDAKELGEFKTLDELKTKLRENMQHEKEHRAMDKKRAEMMDQILEKAKIDAPQMLVDYELDRMMAQLEYDISMGGMTFDDYLKQVDKSKEDLRNDFHADATKRAHMQLIINKIVTDEDLKADAKKMEAEMEKIKTIYADHKDYDEDRARAYIESTLLNQAVFEFLEAQGPEDSQHVCPTEEK